MGKLMMANSTPIRLCWLAPWLDVMGTETDWNPPAQRGKKRSEAAAHPEKESVNKTVNTVANAACFPIFPLATPAQSPI